jgi:hypothetical protein
MTEELDRRIRNTTMRQANELEEMGVRIAIAEVAIDKSGEYTTEEEQKRRIERLDNKEIEGTIHQRITRIEESMLHTKQTNEKEADAATIRARNEERNMHDRIRKLEEVVNEQELVISHLRHLKQGSTQGDIEQDTIRDIERHTPRMATPMATPENNKSSCHRDAHNDRDHHAEEDYSTPQRSNGTEHPRDDRQPQKEYNNR